MEPGSAETVSVCRNLFGYLFQVGEMKVIKPLCERYHLPQLTGNQDADSEIDRNTATSDILKIDKLVCLSEQQAITPPHTITPSPPRTLTPPYPHTITPSHPHTITPSPPSPPPPPPPPPPQAGWDARLDGAGAGLPPALSDRGAAVL